MHTDSKMTDDIRAVLAADGRLPLDVASVNEEDDLFRMGMTSHASVNVMLALEDAFDVEFPEAMLRKSTFESIGAIRTALAVLLERGDAAMTALEAVSALGPDLGRLAPGRSTVDVVGRTRWVADHVTKHHAEDVDRRSRFPSETIEALRAEGLLAALVPTDLGGMGASLGQVGEATFTLAQQCASSAMVFAMHQLQVACLVQHGHTDAITEYLGQVADSQLLLASATTEVGVGGQLRSSLCAIERRGKRFRLEKRAGVISYGAHADAVLATARRSPESPPNDQVLVVCAPPGLELTQTGDWDTLGMRGTCSPGFVLRAEGDGAYVLAGDFGDIAAETMMPVSHVLWSYVWLGIASAAASRARNFVQAEARKKPGTTPAGATRLAELTVVYQQLDALVRAAAGQYEAQVAGSGSAIGSAIAFNSLKVSASTMVVEVVTRALGVCGMAGYSEGTPYSLGRHLRDAHGAALMVNNDRILGDNAQMLLIHKAGR